ncbi:MAG TPA: GvpL/GvpF family gas vesicle protein [Bacillota bacterium]|nr:GvpL/GvpF family gas vesicle protein [Bacillota bacterium]
MNTKAISYLILLMDSLGMKISSENVKSFWGRIADLGDDLNHRLNEDILEPLVYLWEASRRSGEEIPDLQKINSGGSGPQPVGPGFSNGNQHEVEVSLKLLTKEISDDEDFSKSDSSISSISPKMGDPGPRVTQPLEFSDAHEERYDQKKDTNQNRIDLTGRYLYGLVRGTPVSLAAQGIDRSPVHLIWYKDLGALTHSCAPAPYQSNDRDQVTGWLKQHQQVLDLATDRFNNIIPIGFDMILDGSKTNDPDEVVVNWLEQNYESMVELAQKLAGKVEYGIRVSCFSDKLVELAKSHNPAIPRLVKKMAGMKPGTAYLYRSELESLIRSSVNEVRGMMTRELIERFKNIVVDVKEGSITKKFDESGAEIIADLAVLTESAKADDLGTILEDFQNRLQVTVNFTGPWPGYSFVEDSYASAHAGVCTRV